MFEPNPFEADFKVRDAGREKQILANLEMFKRVILAS